MSGGSVRDGYGNALAETVIGLFKTEVVKHLGPWKTKGRLEWETMKWVHWYNKDRLRGAIGCQTSNEKENAFRKRNNNLEKAAQVLNKAPSGKPGTIQMNVVRKGQGLLGLD